MRQPGGRYTTRPTARDKFRDWQIYRQLMAERPADDPLHKLAKHRLAEAKMLGDSRDDPASAADADAGFLPGIGG